MLKTLKSLLYFTVASYFKFFAKIKLARWHPQIVVITGSSGKTTTMALAEAIFAEKAYYSHHANSAFGIPFNILGLVRKTLLPSEWISLFLLAPLKVFSKVPNQKIYIVEADADRPSEGKFLAELLKPDITIWLSSTRTHSMNFDNLVVSGKFNQVEEAIAYEYGYFLESAKNLVIINSDSTLIENGAKRTHVQAVHISEKILTDYKVDFSGTTFELNKKIYKFDFLLPRAAFSSVAAVLELAKRFDITDRNFNNFDVPPGRSSLFKGVKDTTILDSTYNTGYLAMSEIIGMFDKMKAPSKWIVLGDILEQGREEQEEHEKLARVLEEVKVDRIILMGPRISKYTYPILKEILGDRVEIVSFLTPTEVLTYLKDNLRGGEFILFKGARFLEGVIENLLEDKEDARKLARRERIWEERRKAWGL